MFCANLNKLVALRQKSHSFEVGVNEWFDRQAPPTGLIDLPTTRVISMGTGAIDSNYTADG